MTPTLNTGSASLPDAMVGAAYSEEISAALTGIPPYTVQVIGTPPESVSLVVMSNGTASAAVQVSTDRFGLVAGQRGQFTISATDSSGATTARSYDLRIIAPAPEILSTSVIWKVGETSNTSLSATNGTGLLSWTIVAGPVPPGVSFSSVGVLSGTPLAEGAEFQETGRYTNLVQVTDSHTDRVTGAVAPRSVTNTLVKLVRLSYRQNIWAQRPNGPSFSTICLFCHGPGFTPNVSETATTIIGAASQRALCPDRIYVAPGNPEMSLIFDKLRGPDCGERMPQGGPYFDDTRLGRLERWIRELTSQDTD
jgi:hypothetical protein